MTKPTPFLHDHGHYRNLRVYRITEIIFDITYYFTHHYLHHPDRTIDQMIQAARSGKQNIAEGNRIAVTSSETEIKLTNVAKASLEELLVDYEDFMRVRGLKQWEKDNPRLANMRQYVQTEKFVFEYNKLLPKMNEEELGNLAITLIHQAIFLLQRLLETMQKRFIEQGGIKEQMLHARLNYKNTQKSYENYENSDDSEYSENSKKRNH